MRQQHLPKEMELIHFSCFPYLKCAVVEMDAKEQKPFENTSGKLKFCRICRDNLV